LDGKRKGKEERKRALKCNEIRKWERRGNAIYSFHLANSEKKERGKRGGARRLEGERKEKKKKSHSPFVSLRMDQKGGRGGSRDRVGGEREGEKREGGGG